MTDTNLLSRNPNQTWKTPDQIYNPIDEIFHFDLDAAADSENAKCGLFLTEQENALSVSWFSYVRSHKILNRPPAVWLNPPYDFLYPWVEKSYVESQIGCIMFDLLPPNIDNRWFIELVAPGGLVDEENVECWNYIGGLKDSSPGYKPKSNNISRIAFIDPIGGRVSPSKGNISVVFYPSGVEHKQLPADQWRRLF